MSNLRDKLNIDNNFEDQPKKPKVELNKADIEYMLKLINNSKFEIEGKDLQSLFTLIQKLQIVHEQLDK